MDDVRSNELVDERMLYRLKHIESEKARQKERHRQKIERTDWLARLNVKEEGDGHK